MASCGRWPWGSERAGFPRKVMAEMNRSATVFQCLALVLFLCVSLSSAEELILVDQALRQIYPNATGFDQESFVLTADQIKAVEEKTGITFGRDHSANIQMYVAKENGQILGFAFEDIIIGKWGPIHYLAGLGQNGDVLEVVVLDYQEIRGRPVAKKRFLRQYKSKSVHDPVKLGRDIDGVTGATISSRSMTDGVRKLLHVFRETQSR